MIHIKKTQNHLFKFLGVCTSTKKEREKYTESHWRRAVWRPQLPHTAVRLGDVLAEKEFSEASFLGQCILYELSCFWWYMLESSVGILFPPTQKRFKMIYQNYLNNSSCVGDSRGGLWAPVWNYFGGFLCTLPAPLSLWLHFNRILICNFCFSHTLSFKDYIEFVSRL